MNTYKSFQALHLGSTHFWRFFPSRLSLPHFFDDSFLFFHIAYTFSYLNNFLPHPLSLSNLAFQINQKGHHFLLAFFERLIPHSTHTHTQKKIKCTQAHKSISLSLFLSQAESFHSSLLFHLSISLLANAFSYFLFNKLIN